MASGCGIGQCNYRTKGGGIGANRQSSPQESLARRWWLSKWYVFSLPSTGEKGVGRERISPDCWRMGIIQSKPHSECSANVALSIYGRKAGTVSGNPWGSASLPATYFHMLQRSYTTYFSPKCSVSSELCSPNLVQNSIPTQSVLQVWSLQCDSPDALCVLQDLQHCTEGAHPSSCV